MEAKLVGINSEKMKKLILEIYEYRDKISKILDDSQILIDSTRDYYNSEDADKMREKFKKYSVTFDAFLSNIKSYGSDLEVVLHSYTQINLNSIDNFNKQ